MGTSGSYGGSKKSSWKKARDAARGLSGGGSSGNGTPPTPPDTPPPPSNERPEAFDLLRWIGEGLRADDSELRGNAKLRAIPLGQVLSTGTSFAGLPRIGRVTKRGNSDRPVIPGARRIGAALGGGFAIKTDNEAALGQIGLDLDQLRSLSPKVQTQIIIDQVFGASADENEQSFRDVAIVILQRLLETHEEITIYQEVIREAVIEAVYRRALIEIQDQLMVGSISSDQVAERERQIQELIGDTVRAKLSIEMSQRVPTPRECSQVMAEATLLAVNALRAARREIE